MNTENGMPKVVNAPVWKQDTQIEMNGLEFEQIYNFLNNAQGAVAALHSIMQKNLLNGNVKMSFRKLNEDASDYVPMTEEEQKPYQEEFQTMINQANALAKQAVDRTTTAINDQEGVPNLNDIVDSAGNPLKSV